jgi:diguanylate cyclase (GGDEF)-like protein
MPHPKSAPGGRSDGPTAADSLRILEIQNARFDAAINNMPQGLCMFDRERRLVVWNRLYAEIYDLPQDILKRGMTLEDILKFRIDQGNGPAADAETYARRRIEVVENARDASDIVELKNGRIISILHRPMKNGGWVSTHEDITEQRRNESRIRYLAAHDVLTNLANRMQFEERIRHAEGRIGGGENIGILFVDLDRFKIVNDTLGHAVGDEVLKATGQRLTKCCRDSDIVARLGGDEFAILYGPLHEPEDAALLAGRIVNAMAEPFEIGDHRVMIGASVGVAVAPVDGRDAETLMKKADLALYRAKSEGRNTYHFYEEGMDAALQIRRQIEIDLRLGLARGEFSLAFQPLINLEKNRICACEALLRWNHPVRGAVPPAEFIPIAEQTGLIVQIGDWVLRQACSTATGWPDHIGVAVNLSPVQFKNLGLIREVAAALASSGLRPGRLELEITESVLLIDGKSALHTLHDLRDMGVKIAMDDFGTGHSSLSYLRSFPFDKIKIDRAFVRDLPASESSLAIVKAVIGLGSSFGMAISAEGIETMAQLEMIRQQGCIEAQGFLFSRPLPAGAVTELIARMEPATGSEPAKARMPIEVAGQAESSP